MGYADGCEFRIGSTICRKEMPIEEIKRLLATGRTRQLSGFISKRGTFFKGALKLSGGEVVFDFPEREDKDTNKKSGKSPSAGKKREASAKRGAASKKKEPDEK
jgi:hypothetical protein